MEKNKHSWHRIIGTAIFPSLILAFSLGQTTVFAGLSWEYKARDTIYAISSSTDSNIIAMGSRDSHIYLFNREGRLLWNYKTKGTIRSIALSPGGKFVAAGSEDKHLYLFNTKGDLLWSREFPGIVSSVSISRDGKVVAGAIRRWGKYDLYLFDHFGNKLWEFEPYFEIYTISLSADGTAIAVGTRGGTIYLFDSSGEITWEGQLDYAIMSLDFSLDSRFIAVGSQDGKVYLFDRAGKMLWQYQTEGEVNAICCSGDGKILLWSENEVLLAADIDSLVYAVPRRASILRIIIPLIVIIGMIVLLVFTRGGRGIVSKYNLKTRKISGIFWRHKFSYLLLLPTISLLIIFNYYPAFSGIYHAFTKWNPGIYTKFIGMQNFKEILSNKYLQVGMINLVILVIANFLKVLTIPLLVAELIFHLRSRVAQYRFRTLFVIPMVIPTVAVILIWVMIYDPNIGLLNNFLRAVGLPQFTHSWLGERQTALASIIFFGFPWIGVFPFLIYLGGLYSIPPALFDASLIDGAGVVKRFWHIDFPLLSSQIRLLIILTFIGTLQDFYLILIMTGGGPFDATYVPALELYYSAFKFLKFGYACSIGVILVAVMLIGTIFYMRYIKSAVEYKA